MHQILIAEDDINIASDLKSLLQQEGYRVEIVYDGMLAEKMLLRKHYDCLILDINLPGKNGFEVCKSIRLKMVNLPVLMLTAFGEVDDKLAGFDSGADDYLTKPFFFKELLMRVKALIKRGASNDVAAASTTIEDLVIDHKAKSATRAGTSLKLTPREFQIVELLAGARGSIVSKKEIMRHVWSAQVEVNANTIEVFINSIRNKIDKNFGVKLIHTRPGFGYYLGVQSDET